MASRKLERIVLDLQDLEDGLCGYQEDGAADTLSECIEKLDNIRIYDNG